MSSTTFANHELHLAGDFVQETGSNIFLTGKAGTGKTTFLKNLKDRTSKRMIITAPTGVAALNAGGITLHSFFQLPLGPFVPGSDTYEHHKQRQFRFSKEKKQIIQSLDLLVIDEISMVRADLLDAVDSVLRLYRLDNRPFGGVQLLMIGDLHQLSPVAKRDDWELLREYYESVYFFSSTALAQTEFITIELKHIYRQSDGKFIQILNQLRDNRLDAAATKRLNRRYIKDFLPEKDQGYITLTTHNQSARSINNNRLQGLPEKEYSFTADISGDFPEHIYPVPAALGLKKGAQVMFVRNDPSPEKRYYNGKIGRITEISNQHIIVVCPDDPEEIALEPVRWENIKYTLNKETMEIEKVVTGKFLQYPLNLAWAITIHKSQGLTFEKAIIDAKDAFAHGQTYVALSRCKTLDGMVLSSPIASRGVEIDEAIVIFDKSAMENSPSENHLQAAKKEFQRKLLLNCFDFKILRSRLSHLVRLLIDNQRIIRVSDVDDIQQLEKTANQNIFVVSENFKRQLQRIFENGNLPESDAYILERIGKASKWFQDKFGDIFGNTIEKLYLETDNAELGKKTGKALSNLKKEIAVKLAGIKHFEKGFSPSDYLRLVSGAEVKFTPEKIKKPQPPSYTESEIEHPELFQMLKDWRLKKADEQEVANYRILHQRVLIQVAVTLPDNTGDLRKINGVGKKTVGKYGRDLVALVNKYKKKHGI